MPRARTAKKAHLTMLALSLACAFVSISPPPALADTDLMHQGFADYNLGDYGQARDHLQAALSTDFNNAKLHYYLANTYIHLNMRDAGIREFRIAYALEPEKEVGKLSKQALEYLGAEGGEKAKEGATREPDKKPISDPILEKITAQLKQQAESAKASSRTTDDTTLNDLLRRNREGLDRAKADLQRDNSYYRRGRLIHMPLPDEALRQLDTLKNLYDQQKNAYADGSAKKSDEIQKSADNLQSLLKDKTRGAEPHLVPTGTNLYIRTYDIGPAASKPAAAGQTAPAPTATPAAGQTKDKVSAPHPGPAQKQIQSK